MIANDCMISKKSLIEYLQNKIDGIKKGYCNHD